MTQDPFSALSDAFDDDDAFSTDATYVNSNKVEHTTWVDEFRVTRRIRVQITRSLVRQDQRAGVYSPTTDPVAITESITASVSKASVRFPRPKETLAVGGVSYEIRSRTEGVAGQWELDLVPPKK